MDNRYVNFNVAETSTERYSLLLTYISSQCLLQLFARISYHSSNFERITTYFSFFVIPYITPNAAPL